MDKNKKKIWLIIGSIIALCACVIAGTAIYQHLGKSTGITVVLTTKQTNLSPAKAPTTTAVRSTPKPSLVEQWLFTGDSFEGTFVQLNNNNRKWSTQQWRTEFADLRRIGFNTLIVQWVRYGNDDFFTLDDYGTSHIERIAIAAEESNIDLYVGLSLDKSWWQTRNVTAKLMDEELIQNKKTAEQIQKLLRQHKSFRGWYIPHELSDLHYNSKQCEMILRFFKQLTSYLHRIEPLKPVIASGYTDHDKSKIVQFVSWWTRFFNESGVDIWIFQDGAGVAGRSKWQNVLPFVEAIASLDEDFEGDVWLLAEIFTQTDGPPLNENNFKAESADIARILEQLDALGAFNKKIVIYSYFDYMRPSAGKDSTVLYDAYLQHINEKIKQLLKSNPDR